MFNLGIFLYLFYVLSLKLKFLKLNDLDVEDKRVLVRVDFNCPVDDEGKITDDKRIRETIPTIQYLIDNSAKIILMSHFGRPKENGYENKYSLKNVAKRLTELLQKEVIFSKDCIGNEVEQIVAKMRFGQIVLLENLRFHKGECVNDQRFAKSAGCFRAA